MKKNTQQTQARRELVNLAMECPISAAKVIKRKASLLGKAKNTTEAVRLLAEILYISETTVFRDFAE